jgi:3-keto-disaccharide hydrolase
MKRNCVVLFLLAAAVVWLGPSRAGEGDFKALFNGKNFDGWKFELGKADPAKTFKVEEGVIVVSGHPNGYFYTDKSYKNYIIRFDWRYKRPEGLKDDEKFGGNSGLLVHIQEPHKVWPKCVEVQGMNKEHARIFAIGGAKGQFTFDAKALKAARKPVGEWNTTEAIVKDGTITSKVNGKQISTGKGELTEGPLGFQSEGAEIHFKNIKIKVLD